MPSRSSTARRAAASLGYSPGTDSALLLGRTADLKARVVEVEPRRVVRALGRQRQHHRHWARERRQGAGGVGRGLERHDLASLRNVGNLVFLELRGAEASDDLIRLGPEDESPDEPSRRRLEGNLPG